MSLFKYYYFIYVYLVIESACLSKIQANRSYFLHVFIVSVKLIYLYVLEMKQNMKKKWHLK